MQNTDFPPPLFLSFPLPLAENARERAMTFQGGSLAERPLREK